MDADFPSADAPLPDDVSALQALARQLLSELARLRAENAELRNKLDAALQHRFGRRSERRPRRREPRGDERAEPALTLIRQLYAIERTLPALLLPSDEAKEKEKRRQVEEQRRVMRQSQVRPVLEELEKWLERERAGALPRSLLGKAITYCRNNWAALGRYQEAGWLSLDNNLSERVLRAIALGRGNWGVISSQAGGKTAAVLYSVVATCKHLGIDPFVYLREALPGLFAVGEETTGERLMQWLPDRWLLTRTRGSPAAAG